MAINKEWHLNNIMPEKATIEQRIDWHLAHQMHCSCRPIPKKLLTEMEKRNIQVPQAENEV